MNILRHKKWHVRTKENVARVRRDEAKAAEVEKARAERSTLADHEDRVQRLKSKNMSNTSPVNDTFGVDDSQKCFMAGTSNNISANGKQHVNLFTELEEQERKNLATGNKEYAVEKKKEQYDWESKVGIMKRFAEDTKEYSKESEWWEGIPLVREHAKKPKVVESKTSTKFLTSEERKAIKLKKVKNEQKNKMKGTKNGPSKSVQNSVDINILRQERLTRERREQLRVKTLTKQENKDGDEDNVDKMIQLNKDRDRRYNSQFNPEFSRF
ncbi:hypothetical protein ACQ4LE_008405 [Meloidogyne hapla]